MVYIESAEAKKELGRIDDILNEKHLLIGGLAKILLSGQRV